MSTQPSAVPNAPTPQQQIIAAIIGFRQSLATAVAADLGLADLLANGPQHVDWLAEKTMTHSRSLFRLMRALASAGIFTQVSPRVFANTPASDCLRTDVPGSLRSVVRAVLSPGHGEYDAWAGLEHSVRTGEPAFDHLYGYDFWEFLKRNPDKHSIYNEGQQAASGMFVASVVGAYDWGRFSVIADIGGGTGTLLTAILDRHPTCRGILLDLPEVVSKAIPHARMERAGGSFFESVPSGADLYILKTVIHDFADAQVTPILSNIRKVVGPEGRLALVEGVITDSPESTFGKWGDLHMLALLGGAERTAAEYGELFDSSGFELQEVVVTKSPFSILIGRPVG
jgi:hypothetical protein